MKNNDQTIKYKGMQTTYFSLDNLFEPRTPFWPACKPLWLINLVSHDMRHRVWV